MELISEKIKEIIYQAIKGLGFEIKAEEIGVEHPANEEFGDYSTNVAMSTFVKLKTQNSCLAGRQAKRKTTTPAKSFRSPSGIIHTRLTERFSAGKQNVKLTELKSPLDLAELIVSKIQITDYQLLVTRVDVVPPGFINFRLSPEFLLNEAIKIVDEENFFKALSVVGKTKTMVIDYSSPNIAKPFGIGHLRSTNIGQALYNLYKILGWKTIGDNHLGDWGTQFGALTRQIKLKAQSSKCKNKTKNLKLLENLTIEDLEKLYVEFHKEAEERPGLEEEARKWFKKLEDGDQEALRIWKLCWDISMKEFDRIYKLLGVKIDYAYGEAFYHFNGWMDKVLQDVKKKKLLKKSEDALVIDLPGQRVPAMLVKSDGATTYLFRDLATLKFRREKWDPDLVIYEVGAEQKLHFQQVFTVSEILGYIARSKLVHIAHGLIRWEHGKFSTRKGMTIHLEEVINEGIEKAKKIIEGAKIDKNLSLDDKSKIAQAVAIAGIKFNDLKQEPQRDIIFDWDKVLALEGYSAPYLQYTYARCASVLKKANFQFSIFNFQSIFNDQFSMNDEELMLLRSFYKFPEIIQQAAKEFSPHLLCQYLFDLAQKFNLFYQRHRILDNFSPEPVEGRISASQISAPSLSRGEFRLFLTAVTQNILKIGLGILGIEVLERM